LLNFHSFALDLNAGILMFPLILNEPHIWF